MTLVPPSFILIYALEDHLHITPERYHQWRQHADDRGVIIWNRQGEVRIIETAVLDNALHTYEEYHTLLSAGRADAVPPQVERIFWSQGRAVNATHNPVRV